MQLKIKSTATTNMALQDVGDTQLKCKCNCASSAILASQLHLPACFLLTCIQNEWESRSLEKLFGRGAFAFHFIVLYSHRNIEYPKFEGTLKNHWAQLLVPKRTTQNSNPMSESVVQMLFVIQQPWAVSTALGSMFHAHHHHLWWISFSLYPTWASRVPDEGW